MRLGVIVIVALALRGGAGWNPRRGVEPTARGGTRALQARPNILWLTSEDHGPHMGCYGDTFATTPNVDRLAARGMIYARAWSNAPVCAPARTAIISGLYPPSTGSEHMRSMVPYPRGLKMLPQLLREAGYHCTNNAKEDYNLEKPGQVWDESSRQAHWRRSPRGYPPGSARQPFFAVFNSEKSHESRIRVRPHTAVHDPAKVRIPAYHPDTPEVRQDWAQYYDCVTAADADAGARLKELEADGLAEETIVFYFADHGSGMPRCKRWPYNSGLQVPLVVYFPEKWRHLAPKYYRPGGRSDRLVSFVDLAPSALSLAGIRPPDWMQGYAFTGRFETQPQPYLYGFRGRMDERSDMVRSVTDGRYVYVRNYMPHRIYGQHLDYMFQTPTTRVWKRLHDEGRLTPEQDAFWKPKPPEELYDLESDPDEVRNLAASQKHQGIRKRLRKAQQELALRIRDVGFLPEGEIHERSRGSTPYDMGTARDPLRPPRSARYRPGDRESRYPFRRIFETAELASLLGPAIAGDPLSRVPREALPALKKALGRPASGCPDSAVRYWAALGILMRGRSAVEQATAEIRLALGDGSPYVRVVAAEALARFGGAADRDRALAVLSDLAVPQRHGVFAAVAALHAIDDLGREAASLHPRLRAEVAPAAESAGQGRYAPYVPRLLESILGAPARRP